ncbi:sensor domain-containing protein [Nocardioides sp. MH1]|uniref:sensor domain-containing protein n=1 Tax=Nocardioides sp. MH1 TaxID=3242490 RepID=UPI0035208DC5
MNPPRAPRLALAALAAAAALTACGSPGDLMKDSGDDDGGLRTSDLLITKAALPQGWRDSNSQGLDYRTTVCGVDIEPQEPVRATSIRFAKGPLGPFLEQHVRIYDTDAAATDVIAALRDALPGCHGYTTTGTASGSPTATFRVEPLTVAGAPPDSVAWRQTSQGDLPITADVLLVRRGTAAVLLMSYVLRGRPEADVLTSAAAAVPEVD